MVAAAWLAGGSGGCVTFKTYPPGAPQTLALKTRAVSVFQVLTCVPVCQ